MWENPITEVKQHKSMLVLGWVTVGIFLLNLEVTKIVGIKTDFLGNKLNIVSWQPRQELVKY